MAALKVFVKYAAFTAGVTFLVLLAVREVLLLRMPSVEKVIPHRAAVEEIPVPRRPGTRSIRIVGPPLKVVRFQLDFKRNPQPIDWHLLERMDKKADVMVEGTIDINGGFSINRVQDKGHPRAGRYISSILRTWQFTPYKSGKVKYYFNVPSRVEQMKLQIDLRQLTKNLKFLRRNEVLEDGMLFYIEGLNARSVMLIN
ncbi:MAG: hypothetical protein D6743_12345 [Calditrichaeota bacterium]|nr:MAG: hypothetical protein D6743_12345 [Calditrichota bacterium]